MRLKMRTIYLYYAALAFTLHFSSVVSQSNPTPETIVSLSGKTIGVDTLEHYITAQMQHLKVPGMSFVLINEGMVVFHEVYGYADIKNGEAVTKSTIFEGASLSKPLFAYFVMTYVEEGLLDLDKPLYHYLPFEDIAYDDRYKQITARMVLSHTTGFPNWRTDYENKRLFIQFEPGTAFHYSGEGYQYLAKVLMHLLQTDNTGLEEKFQERVALPLGLEYTKYIQDDFNISHKALGYRNALPVPSDNDTKFGAAYSVHSESRDFSKWVIALLEKRGLNETSFDELFKTQVILPEEHPQREAGVSSWALGFAKATLPFGDALGHGGNNRGYTSLFALVPEKKWGCVIFTNADQSPLPLLLLQYLMS